jgi:hypothetical protein
MGRRHASITPAQEERRRAAYPEAVTRESTMTSRERVQRAFDHQQPDRVPRYEQTVCARVASEIMGRRMRTGGGQIRYEETAARWESDEAGDEYAARIFEDVGDLIRELGFDIAGIPWRHATKPSARLDAFTFEYGNRATGWWSVYHYDEATDVFDEVDSVYRHEGLAAVARMVEAAERGMAEARPPAPEGYEPLLRIARRAGGERFLKSGEGGLAVPLGPAWLEACALRPDLIERYLDTVVHGALLALPVAAKVGVGVLWAGGDLASNKGPFYSPAMFRRFIVPRVRAIADAAHQLGMKYLFRTDGNVWSIADDLFVDSHVDGFGEIDIDAGMDLPEIREACPHLTLWGGVSCGKLLTFGTPAQIRDEVKRVMEALKPGSGLIFGSSNSIHAGIPVASFVAMHEAARECGGYG